MISTRKLLVSEAGGTYDPFSMWKRTVQAVLFVALATATGRAQTPAPPISKEAIRQAIAAFRQNPASPQAENARPLILKYAESSTDIQIAITPKVLPWLNNGQIALGVRADLLAAYVAGNTQSQLDKGKAGDDPLAGTEQVIATYRQMQKADPALKIPEVEQLVDLQRQGKLADHLKDV